LSWKDGTAILPSNEGSVSFYADHCLPLTITSYENAELATASLAPVLEPKRASEIPGLPLPGPPGCIYAVALQNTGSVALSGKARLALNEDFLTDYEHCDQPVETRIKKPYMREYDKNTLIL
jgi:hypothetical protein